MRIQKPRITTPRIKEILRAVGEEKKYDDINFKRETISSVKKWYNSLSWREAKLYAEGDEVVLKAREDYLEKRAEEITELNNPLKQHYTDLSVTASKIALNLNRYLDNLKKFEGDIDVNSTIGNEIYGGQIPDTEEINDWNRWADAISPPKPISALMKLEQRLQSEDALKRNEVNKPRALPLRNSPGWGPEDLKRITDSLKFKPEQFIKMYDVNKSLALNLLNHLKHEFSELTYVTDWADLTYGKISYDFIERLKLKANRGDFTGKCQDCPR